jgi:glycosyltransferase involved in cell wall biosynthesis
VTLASIITVVKDDTDGLVATHSSLIAQLFQGWEMIIVVGASKDTTLSIALEFQAKDQRIHVLEEKGKSIYGAMNEGLEVAKGEFVWFMNAGDRFAGSLVLSNAVEEIETSKVGVVVGGYEVNGKARDTKFQFSSKTLSAITFAFNRHGGCHQAMIFRTTSLREVGCFDTSYSLASDFKAVLGVIRTAGARRANELYALIEPGGLADQGIFVVHEEKHRIRKIVFGNSIVTITSFLWTFAAQSKIKFRRRLESRKVKGG